MRKSLWLLSAGIFAMSAPVAAQETTTEGSPATTAEGPTEAAAVEEAPAVDEEQADDAIIVTATRRNEALSDVPLAVSAVTAEQLENTGASDIRQLNQVSPSLLVSSTSSEAGGAVARIRGIGTVGDNAGLESSVGVFVDGVYRSRVGGALTELGPLDRIEILRGPQGTLFGRNTSAGLIHVITAKPRFTREIYGEATIGNYDLRRFEAGVTGPISDSFAARIDGVFLERDGFLEDTESGRDVNDRDRWMIRAQGLYQPSDNLSVRIVGDITRRREECCAAPYLPARDFTASGPQDSTFKPLLEALGATINDDPFDRDVSITPDRDYDSDVDDHGISGEIVYDFGGAELTSITAYRYNNAERGQDPDFNNLDLWYRESGGGYETRFKTFTQELRLQGEAFAGRLDWLVGGYYANEKLRQLDNLSYGADYERYINCILISSVLPTALAPAPTGHCINTTVVANTITFLSGLPLDDPRRASIPLLGALIANPARPGFGSIAAVMGMPGFSFNGTGVDDEYSQTSNNWALFTHNIFDITDTLKLTVGARYTHEKKKLSVDLNDTNSLCAAFQSLPAPLAALVGLQTLPCVIPSVPGGHLSDSESKSESKVSGTVVLSYKPTPQLLTYASYSRGYKAGGFNLDRSALARSVVGTAVGGVLPSADLSGLEFRPEINDAFELGLKYNGRGIDVNVAAFHQLFEDFQLNTFNGINFEVVNINSCEDDLDGADEDASSATGACTGDTRAGVKSMGVELEVFTRPLTDVNFNFGAVYANTRYRNDLVGTNGQPLSAVLFQLPGRRISNSSEWSVTSSVAWTPPIGSGGMRGLVYADARYISQFNTGSDLDLEKLQDGFMVVNARVGLHGRERRWGVELWVQNLFDEDFMQVAFDAPPAQGSGTQRAVEAGFIARSTALFGAFLGEPRTYGLTLRGKF